MTKYKQIVNRIIKAISNTAPGSEVYLYGSRARGDSKSSSDWDILILLNLKNVSFEQETKIMDEFYTIELETGEVLSPMVYTKNEWNNRYSVTPLYENIEKEAIRLS